MLIWKLIGADLPPEALTLQRLNTTMQSAGRVRLALITFLSMNCRHMRPLRHDAEDRFPRIQVHIEVVTEILVVMLFSVRPKLEGYLV